MNCRSPLACICCSCFQQLSTSQLNCRRLIAVKGLGNVYLERIEFVWALLSSSTPGPLDSTVAQWTCQGPTNAPAFRASSSSNQPQCLSRDGKSCIVAADCFNLRYCAASFSSTPVTCAVQDGANDPLHWCLRARGALGEIRLCFRRMYPPL